MTQLFMKIGSSTYEDYVKEQIDPLYGYYHKSIDSVWRESSYCPLEECPFGRNCIFVKPSSDQWALLKTGLIQHGTSIVNQKGIVVDLEDEDLKLHLLKFLTKHGILLKDLEDCKKNFPNLAHKRGELLQCFADPLLIAYYTAHLIPDKNKHPSFPLIVSKSVINTNRCRRCRPKTYDFSAIHIVTHVHSKLCLPMCIFYCAKCGYRNTVSIYL